MLMRRFTKEFEAEVAAAFADQRAHSARGCRRSWDRAFDAGALGWRVGRSRDRLIEDPPAKGSEDVAAGLKRLRRENCYDNAMVETSSRP